jgi:hypothetical protein
MTPRHFAALAVVAGASAIAAVAVYSSSVPWSSASESGAALFPNLASVTQIGVIEIKQAGKTLTLAHKGKTWTLKEHDSYPASQDKVKALLAGLSRAQLVEAKTRRKDRYALLGVEDPSDKDAKSQLVSLLDWKGKVVAAAIVGNEKTDAFGIGQSGTYVRKPGDMQAWLANANIDAGIKFTDWIDPRLFETNKDDIEHVTVTMPGEDPLEIVPDKTRSGFTLASIPDGMKLKYTNIVDEIVRAASSYDFDDVRKIKTPPADAKVNTVVLEIKGDLKATAHIWKDGDAEWLSLEATGKGPTKKVADALMARTKGWEFRIPESRIKEILKRRDDLLERVSS